MLCRMALRPGSTTPTGAAAAQALADAINLAEQGRIGPVVSVAVSYSESTFLGARPCDPQGWPSLVGPLPGQGEIVMRRQHAWTPTEGGTMADYDATLTRNARELSGLTIKEFAARADIHAVTLAEQSGSRSSPRTILCTSRTAASSSPRGRVRRVLLPQGLRREVESRAGLLVPYSETNPGGFS